MVFSRGGGPLGLPWSGDGALPGRRFSGDPLSTGPDSPERQLTAQDAEGPAQTGTLTEPVLAVDAMGGDHAPDEIVAGALAAHREHGVRVLLTGPSARLSQALTALNAADELQIVAAEDNLAMNEGALASLRRP